MKVSKAVVVTVVGVAAVGLGIGGAVAAMDDGSESPTTPPDREVEVVETDAPGPNEPEGQNNQAGVIEPGAQAEPDVQGNQVGATEPEGQHNQAGADQPNAQNG